MWGRAFYGSRYFAPRYFGDGSDVVAPPIFSGTIADISETEGTGTHQYDLSGYFTGADSYSIAPALEAGWSFNTLTAVLEIDTDAVGIFGPFVVTATNASGTDDSNGFTVTVVAAPTPPTDGFGGGGGGPQFFQPMSATIGRRKRRRDEEDEARQPIVEEMAPPPPETPAAPAPQYEDTARLEQLAADAQLYGELAAGTMAVRFEIAAAERRRLALQREEEEAIAALLMILANDDT
jgi:hypothetical protein